MADTYTVLRWTTIDASPAAVYAQVANFRNWRSWSPWEELDPNLERAYGGPESGIGAWYAWSGNRKAGKGRMEIIDATPPERLRMDLTFEKPFKSRNENVFLIEPADEGSRVTWTMTGPMSPSMRVLTIFKSMDSMVGPDFEKGLARLKTVAEGSRPS